MSSCRLFFAIQPPPGAVEILARLQRELHSRIAAPESHRPPALRWTPREQLHITLLFSPAFPRGEIAALREAATRVLSPLHPFEVSLNSPQIPPPRGKPRILWLPVSRGVTPLREIQQELESCHPALAPGREHGPHRPRFTPHATIGRFPGKAGKPESRAIGKVLAPGNIPAIPPWTVREIGLIESVLSSRGPEYKHIHNFRLSE